MHACAQGRVLGQWEELYGAVGVCSTGQDQGWRGGKEGGEGKAYNPLGKSMPEL